MAVRMRQDGAFLDHQIQEASLGRVELPPSYHTGRIFPPPPILLEGRFWLEYAELLASRIYRDGPPVTTSKRPVLLVPGFFASDATMATLGKWLRRGGYWVGYAGIRLNIKDSDTTARQIEERLVALHERTGKKVTIIGQSRGGLLAKVVADRHPNLVTRVVTLGSPLRDPYDAHPATIAGVHLARLANFIGYGDRGAAELAFLLELATPTQVPLTAIYTRTDGIVNWKTCTRDDAENVEVGGSHCGLAVNAAVYRELAALLTRKGRRLN